MKVSCEPSRPPERADDFFQAGEEDYRALFDAVPIAVFVCDEDAVIRYYNKCAVELWGRAPRRGVEKNCGSVRLYLPDGTLLPHDETPLREVLRSGKSVSNVEVLVERSDRSRIPVVVNFAPLRNSAGITVGVVTSFSDISERKKKELQLRDSESRYRALFESIDEGFCVVEMLFDREGRVHDARFLETNPAFAVQSGMGDVVGKTVRELAMGGAEAWLNACGDVALMGVPIRREGLAQGMNRWFDAYAFRLGPAEDRKVAILFQDVSTRKTAEIALRDAQARLIAGVSAASVGTWIWDVEADRVYADFYVAKLFNVTPEQANGGTLESYLNAIHPDDRPRVRAMIDQTTERGTGYECEYRLQSGNGWRWFAARGEIERAVDGRVIRLTGALIDITERQRDEKLAVLSHELQAQAEMFDLTLSHISDFAYTFNRDGRFAFVNKALLDLWGLKLEEAVGKNFFDLKYPAEMAAKLQGQIQQVIDTRQGITDETPYTSPTGATGYYEYIFRPIFDSNGSVQSVAGSTREITERKRSEQNLREMEEQAREAARRLTESQQDLEMRVSQRTAELDAANKALTAQIREVRRTEYARKKLQSQMASVQEDERSRISRELHDEIGQLLVALKLEMTAIETAGVPAPVSTRYRTLRELVDTVAKEVHEIAYKLRPTALDDLGLVRTLSNYVQEWSVRANVSVGFHVVGMDDQRLPSQIETTLYRIVQEALNNVLRHAQATRVSLILEREAEMAHVILEDDGKGFDVESLTAPKNARRLGILGMKERAALVGGEVKIESQHPTGTAVFVRIPLSIKDSNE